jgi:hypothetical protein
LASRRSVACNCPVGIASSAQHPRRERSSSLRLSPMADRLLHHAETVTIEGNSFRMKDQIEA